jgi:hypothetical protein
MSVGIRRRPRTAALCSTTRSALARCGRRRTITTAACSRLGSFDADGYWLGDPDSDVGSSEEDDAPGFCRVVTANNGQWGVCVRRKLGRNRTIGATVEGWQRRRTIHEPPPPRTLEQTEPNLHANPNAANQNPKPGWPSQPQLHGQKGNFFRFHSPTGAW